jgi:hypothetical protein
MPPLTPDGQHHYYGGAVDLQGGAISFATRPVHKSRSGDVRRPVSFLRHAKAPEDWLFCALLRMVLEHCARGDGTYDSFERRCNTEALRLLAEAGFFHIDSDIGDRIRATAVPKLDAFLAWMGEGTSTSGER